MQTIFGRKRELKLLDEYCNSKKAEFVALYGRRRVGKTFLIDEYFQGNYAFFVTGVIAGERDEQMSVFVQAMRDIGYVGKKPQTWMDTFYELSKLLTERLQPKEKCVIFIDELPCFDTPKSGFIRAFGHFWNSWAQKHKQVMLIVCGSATSWMVRNIIDNHGGLHNRITHEIHLQPFDLHDTEQMIKAMNIGWDRLSILQMYMAIGGIPYYINMIEKGESVAQTIDRLFFSENAPLKYEYDRLFASLFRDPTPYLDILQVLSTKKSGVSRNEIAKAIGKHDNGHLTDYLNNLIKCDFVRYYFMRSKKIKKTDGLYQLTDMFVIFYNTFMKKPVTDNHFWSNHLLSPTINNWLGLSFERVCMAHINQIKRALGVERIGTEYYSWRSKDSENGAQIDLLIERADRIINMCEIKYSAGQYALDKEEDMKIRNRMVDFQQETATRCAVVPIIVTTFGLKANAYSGGIQAEVLLDDLFSEVKQ